MHCAITEKHHLINIWTSVQRYKKGSKKWVTSFLKFPHPVVWTSSVIKHKEGENLRIDCDGMCLWSTALQQKRKRSKMRPLRERWNSPWNIWRESWNSLNRLNRYVTNLTHVSVSKVNASLRVMQCNRVILG